MSGADLGVDSGGTFTDFVAADGRILKRPSDAENPGRVLAEGAAHLLTAAGSRPAIVHGTTVATNALLTENVATVGVLFTKGFRDLLAIGRQNRPELYALHVARPWRPPARDLCAEIDERLDASGDVVKALDVEEVRRAGRRLVRRGAQAIAVCFLHSFRNPRHERAAVRALAELGVPLTSSAELVPEFREFERFSTAFANAQLMPLLARYRQDLESRLGEISRAAGGRGKPGITIIRSDGGASGLAAAAKEPVRLALSGPAAGLVGARALASRRGRTRLLTLDMGGTSTDVALLDGIEPVVPRGEIAGRPLLVPSMDIHTVGAGGGSIAHRDSGGALRVGPESAGARPGPACYGHGGPATVTDAHVFLGRIPGEGLLGGAFPLDREAAARVIDELAQALGLDATETAEGILRVAEAVMERALRTISLERGHDPREFALVSFGGAGGLHAAALAESLGMREVVVPPDPGVLSATGMLHARVKLERSKGLVDLPLEELSSQLERRLAPLVKDGLRAMKREGLAEDDVVVQPFADLRYAGQSHELTVPLDDGVRGAFDRAHEKRYGFAMPERAVRVVAVRVRLAGPAGDVRGRKLRRSSSAPTPRSTGRTRFDGRSRRTPVFDREDLRVGPVVKGPAIVTEYSATTVVPPGWSFEVESRGNLVMRRDG